jgi:hypothetical protein
LPPHCCHSDATFSRDIVGTIGSQESFMRITWDSSLAAVASFALVPVGFIAIFVYLLWPSCEQYEKLFATDAHGRTIVSVLEACGSIGTTVVESIQLKSGFWERKTILKYEPNGGVIGCKGSTFPGVVEPSIDWHDPGVIHISIAVVASIIEKHDELDGMRVTYDIGPVLSEVCGFGKT